MHSVPHIDETLLALARLPAEERVFRMAPKGGRFNFLATEDELLSVFQEKLPQEHGPYLVTFCQNDLLQFDKKNARVEKLEDFQGWLKNMTFRIFIWPEAIHRLVKERNCPELEGTVGSMMLAVEHCPLELFGQKKIAENESRVWLYGSVASYYGNLHYINHQGASMYSPVKNRLKRLCPGKTIFRFAAGEETELKGTGMSEKAAKIFAQLPEHKFKPAEFSDQKANPMHRRFR